MHKHKHVLPEDFEILQHLQETLGHLLPVCGHQCPVLRCGVLGREYLKERLLQAGSRGASSVFGTKLDPLATVAERRTMHKLLATL